MEKLEEWTEELTNEYIPERLHPLVEVVGVKAFLELCSFYGGSSVYLPTTNVLIMPLRDQRIRKEYNGKNVTELGRKYRLSERQIRHVLNKE